MARDFIAPLAVEAPYKAKRTVWTPPKATIAGRTYCAHDGDKACPVWTQPGEAYCRKHRP